MARLRCGYKLFIWVEKGHPNLKKGGPLYSHVDEFVGVHYCPVVKDS